MKMNISWSCWTWAVTGPAQSDLSVWFTFSWNIYCSHRSAQSEQQHIYLHISLPQSAVYKPTNNFITKQLSVNTGVFKDAVLVMN